MKKLPAKYITWFLWAYSIGMGVVVILFAFLLARSVGTYIVAEQAADLVAFIAMATLGTFVASRRPEYAIGWLVLSLSVLAVTGEAAFDYAYYAVHVRSGALPGGAIAALLGNALWISAYALLLYLALFFPRGTLLSPRWRWVAWGAGGAFAAALVASSLLPEVEVDVGVRLTVTNPLAVAGAEPILNVVLTTALVAIVILWVAAGVSLVLCFVHSRGNERQQMKWFAYSAALFTVFMIAVTISDESGYNLPDPWDEILVVPFFLQLILGMAVAILKYHLYDIDTVINRTLVYGVLTGALALVYFGSVILMQSVFTALDGQQSVVAIVISTLLIAALFAPLRQRIQDLIDRRFFRRKYNAERVLAHFAQTARDEVDLDVLTGELVRVVQETMQPTSVSVWLREPTANGQTSN